MGSLDMPTNRYRSEAAFPSRPAGSSPSVTGAIGMGETRGHRRARRMSLFTRTVIWVTGMICLAFLLGSLAQAWTNSQLMQRLITTEQQTQQAQAYHDSLQQQASYYSNPAVIETEARERLGYVRPGETPVVIVGTNNPPSHPTPPAPKPSPPQNFWQEWWNIFFG